MFIDWLEVSEWVGVTVLYVEVKLFIKMLDCRQLDHLLKPLLPPSPPPPTPLHALIQASIKEWSLLDIWLTRQHFPWTWTKKAEVHSYTGTLYGICILLGNSMIGCDISKLSLVISLSRAVIGEWNLRQFWNIRSGIYARYHVQIMLLFVHTTTPKRFDIFTCRFFKLSWNTTALSQSNCRNFSSSSI